MYVWSELQFETKRKLYHQRCTCRCFFQYFNRIIFLNMFIKRVVSKDCNKKIDVHVVSNERRFLGYSGPP